MAAEDAGWDGAFVNDHLGAAGGPDPAGDEPIRATTTMDALARLRPAAALSPGAGRGARET